MLCEGSGLTQVWHKNPLLSFMNGLNGNTLPYYEDAQSHINCWSVRLIEHTYLWATEAAAVPYGWFGRRRQQSSLLPNEIMFIRNGSVTE